MVTHPHPNPPFEGEGIISLLPLQGGGREGDGVRKLNAVLKCDKVELKNCKKIIRSDVRMNYWTLVQ